MAVVNKKGLQPLALILPYSQQPLKSIEVRFTVKIKQNLLLYRLLLRLRRRLRLRRLRRSGSFFTKMIKTECKFSDHRSPVLHFPSLSFHYLALAMFHSPTIVDSSYVQLSFLFLSH